MSKNKLKKFADMASYPHVFEADFESVMRDGFSMRGKWHEWFGNANPIVLELGCGRGEYTVGLARADKDKNYIGVDIKGARMHAGATESHEEGMKNVAFLRTRIELIDKLFAPSEVGEIWVTFPDPQMRKARKRLVGTMMLERYRQFLVSGGAIHLKTDSKFLYEYMEAMLKENGIEAEEKTDDLYAGGAEGPVKGIKTYYEQKWISVGLTIKYIRFSMPEGIKPLVEPDVEIERDDYHSVGRGVKFKSAE